MRSEHASERMSMRISNARCSACERRFSLPTMRAGVRERSDLHAGISHTVRRGNRRHIGGNARVYNPGT